MIVFPNSMADAGCKFKQIKQWKRVYSVYDGLLHDWPFEGCQAEFHLAVKQWWQWTLG